MQDQNQEKKERISYDPGDYIPDILRKHKGDMEWMETHKEEYLKAEEEFVQKVTKAVDWHPDFARAWLTRAVWYEIVDMAKVYTYPKWLEEDYPETEDLEEDSENQLEMEGTTMVTISSTPPKTN